MQQSSLLKAFSHESNELSDTVLYVKNRRRFPDLGPCCPIGAREYGSLSPGPKTGLSKECVVLVSKCQPARSPPAYLPTLVPCQKIVDPPECMGAMNGSPILSCLERFRRSYITPNSSRPEVTFLLTQTTASATSLSLRFCFIVLAFCIDPRSISRLLVNRPAALHSIRSLSFQLCSNCIGPFVYKTDRPRSFPLV